MQNDKVEEVLALIFLKWAFAMEIMHKLMKKINGLTLGALLFNSNKQIRSKPTITIYFRSKAIFDRYSI